MQFCVTGCDAIMTGGLFSFLDFALSGEEDEDCWSSKFSGVARCLLAPAFFLMGRGDDDADDGETPPAGASVVDRIDKILVLD